LSHPAALALVGLLLIGAAPATEPLPVPPIPPGGHRADDAAPIPNESARAPAEAPPSSVRVTPSLYRREKTFVQGEGYMPGSSFKENEQERISKPTPGFNLRMTLP
jgi:hypothetical protein